MRILVCGDVRGQFNTLLNRVETVNKKNGPFQMLLCVGSFFSSAASSKSEWDEFVKSARSFPLPAFILGPASSGEGVCYPSGQDGGDLLSNLTYLGSRGLFTTSEGLKIAYLSGVQSKGPEDKQRHIYQESDVDALASNGLADGFAGVDVMLTSEWPRNIQEFAPTPPPVSTQGSPSVARLAHTLQPRYHFAAGQDVFYERAPFRNHKILAENPRHVTRFISVANVGNPDKKNRWLYAFQITPMAEMTKAELIRQPDLTTESPLASAQAAADARQQAAAAAPSQQFFFDPKSLRGGQRGRGGHRGRGRGRGSGDHGGFEGRGGYRNRHDSGRHHPSDEHGGPPAKRPMDDRGPDCWFCLGSPKVEKHLIVTVGNQCYVALAKGPLVDDHLLVLPVGHHADSVSLPPVVHTELEAYKKAIIDYCASKRQSCVFFERNFKSRHLQLQAVPIHHGPEEVKRVFLSQGKERGITLVNVDSDEQLDQLLDKHPSYFLVEFADGQRLFHFIKPNANFPLQFAREVLVLPDLLDRPRRMHWKDVKLTSDEETALTQKVRTAFAKFDPVADDEEDDE